METSNRTTYICGICNTKPDQLSHHNAHLNSKTHKEQKIICEYEIRRYMIEFLFLQDKEYWNIYLQNEYFEERMSTEDISVVHNCIFQDWIVKKSFDIEKKYRLKNHFDSEWWINKYKEITHKNCDINDKIDKILFLDWKIKYLIQEAETIQKTVRRLKHFDEEIINKINKNELTQSDLLKKLIDELCFSEGVQCVHNQITDNPNTTLNRHKICNVNKTNIDYLIYQNFKDKKIICKDVETEVIQLGESRKSKRPMWFIVGENATHDQVGKVTNMFKTYIVDLLKTTTLDENTKNKLISIFGKCSPTNIIHLRELFREN
jgi:hypothetical protein